MPCLWFRELSLTRFEFRSKRHALEAQSAAWWFVSCDCRCVKRSEEFDYRALQGTREEAGGKHQQPAECEAAEDVKSSFTLKVNPESLFSESSDSSVPTVPHLGSFTGSGAVRPGA